MSPLSNIYTYLYSSRIKEGYPPSTDPGTGTMVLVCCLTMILFSIGLLVFLIVPELLDVNQKWIKSGKQIGQLLGILMIVILYPIVRNTIGKKSNYEKIISQFNSLSTEDQEAEAKKGKVFMILSLSSIAIPMLLGLLID